ncbi:MAG: CusA/CzcA family heavy metal efflux RND transporter [Bacteriodetes bacterium]|nr:CusA/CzcA family heavy metal efflux RND transporter [Bacteroidota bacterium]
MFAGIIRFSVENKLVIGLLVLALVAFGSYSLTQLPIDAVPDITNNQVLIITVSPSLAAPEVERLITFPIEQAIVNIPGKTELRSFSRFGLSLVTIVFNDETDVYWARQQVSERLIQLQQQIPAYLGTPELGPVSTGLGEIYQYSVKAKKGYEGKYTPTELRDIQDWTIRKQLLGTEGVADVSSFGGGVKQYEVAVNPDKLKSHNITLSELYSVLNTNNQNAGGAYIERNSMALFIRTEGLLHSKEEIENTLVKTVDGIPLLVKDIADIRLGTAVRYGAMHQTDYGEVAGAIVMMIKGGNSSQTIKNVKQRIAEIQKSLPEGVEIEPFLDRTKMVNNAISTVETNLLEGALIVVFILVLFLGNLRAGLVVASVIPLSMLFAVIMMNLFGVSGNLMSLGALDFGLIIDGAVIIVESVMHVLHSFTKRHSIEFQPALPVDTLLIDTAEMNKQVRTAATTMMNSAVFGQVIILIVYLPILTLVGIEGKMFKPMAQTVCFAVLGAFLLSLTYVPMITSLVLDKRLHHKKTFADIMMLFIEKKYIPSLQWAIRRPVFVLGSIGAAFIVSLVVLFSLGGEFIPELEEGDFAVDTRIMTGGSLSQTIEVTQKAAQTLKNKFPEVIKVVTKIGSGEIPTDPMPIEAADMMIILKDKHEWTSASSFEELSAKMSATIEEIPGISFGFQFPVQMRFNELMTGARQDIVCKVFGEDLDTLAKYSQQIGGIAASIPGACELYVEQVTGLPQIVVSYNRNAISQYGISVEEANRTVSALYAGIGAGIVYEGEKRYDLVIRTNKNIEQSIEAVRTLQVPSYNGQQIPLQVLADVRLVNGPNQIQRESARRRIIVGFNVRGRDVESVVKDVQKRVEDNIHLPPGYSITYGGQFENLTKAKNRLAVAVPVALLLIIVLLYFTFKSVRLAMLIFTAIPLSAVGGIFALVIRGMPFSISAGVGFIALFGVAVLNGIVLIAEYDRRKLRNERLISLVIKGASQRLRPVLMTAAVASLGFMPMALSQGAGAEVQRPLATVVIGGLLSSTFLTLIVLPILYRLAEQFYLKRQRRKQTAINVIILVFFFFITNTASATPNTTLDSLIQVAKNKNIQLQIARKNVEHSTVLFGTAWEVPHSLIDVEYGNVNSAYNDIRMSFTQTLPFPTFFTYAKDALLYSKEIQKLQQAQAELDLAMEIRKAFYSVLVLHRRLELQMKIDSVYEKVLEKETQRAELGETPTTMKIQSSVLKKQSELMVQRLQTSKQLLLLRLRQMVNDNIQDSVVHQTFEYEPNSTDSTEHPLLKVFTADINRNDAVLGVEKSKLLPQLTLGVSKQSFRGWMTSDDNMPYYNSSSTFFTSYRIGISLPLFFVAQQSKIEAAGIQKTIAEMEYKQALLKFTTHKQLALLRYRNAKSMIDTYNQTILQQNQSIRNSITKQLQTGDVSYIEWSTMFTNTNSVENAFYDAVEEYNNAAIELDYYNAH